MSKLSRKWINIVLLIFVITIPFVLELQDHAITGDEVVTYSMANNSDGGFVFSEGRVASYLKEYVFSDSVGTTLSNLVTEAKDVLARRKNARFFTYAPDPETRFYTHDEMKDWFEKREYERFNLGHTWLFSQSDDANSYLYYCFLNAVSSMITAISGTKWIGFILNSLLYGLLLWSVFQMTQCFKMEKTFGLTVTLLIGLSYEILTRLIYFRPYILAMIFVIWISIYHLKLWDAINTDSESLRSYPYAVLIPLMMLAYISHYTTSIVLASLGFVTLLLLIQKKKTAVLWKYVGFCLLSGLLAILIDPVSLAGLLSKFTSGSGSSSGSFFTELSEYILRSIFPTILFLGWTVILFLISKGKGLQTLWKDPKKRLLLFVLTVFSFVILAGTKGARYLSVMTPLFLFLLIDSLCESLLSLNQTDRIQFQKPFALITLVLFLSLNVYLSYSSLNELNQQDTELRNVISHYQDKECIYFRVRRSGYEFVPYLSEFRGAQVITVTSENWQALVSDQIFHNNDLIICFAHSAENEEADLWLEKNRIILASVLYDSPLITIYNADIK